MLRMKQSEQVKILSLSLIPIEIRPAIVMTSSIHNLQWDNTIAKKSRCLGKVRKISHHRCARDAYENRWDIGFLVIYATR
jgi:hypothetical protein